MVTTPLGLVQLLLLVGAFIVTVLSGTGAGAAVARCAPADHLAAAGGRAQVTDAPVRATLPPPAACGAPASFLEWRQGQPEAICHVVDSPQRISALVLPTGSGKSLVAATLATLTGWRTGHPDQHQGASGSNRRRLRRNGPERSAGPDGVPLPERWTLVPCFSSTEHHILRTRAVIRDRAALGCGAPGATSGASTSMRWRRRSGLGYWSPTIRRR